MIGVGGCELDGGGGTDAGSLGNWWRRLWMQRRGDKVQNPRGEPLGFIGATGARRATAHLGPRACHDTSPCHVAGYMPAIPILSHQNRPGRFAFLSGSDSFPAEGIRARKSLLYPVWAQKAQGSARQSRWPSQRGTGPRATNTQVREHQ